MGARLNHLAVALLFALSLSACQTNKPADLSQEKIKEIETIWETISVHKSFTRVKEPSLLLDGSPRFSASYTATASYDEVKRFYRDELARNGWQFIREREPKDRGRIRGEREVDFQKNGYEIEIYYAGKRKMELGWDYQIELSLLTD
jgi:hypothetical protein